MTVSYTHLDVYKRQTGERRYALISKADYWSGNANYRDFEKIG